MWRLDRPPAFRVEGCDGGAGRRPKQKEGASTWRDVRAAAMVRNEGGLEMVRGLGRLSQSYTTRASTCE